MTLVYLASGLDAEFAWGKAVVFTGAADSGTPKTWQSPASDPPDVQAWLSCLKQLHATGAPLRETLEAFAQSLETDLHQDLDRFVESAPQKAQVALLIFFAPGAFFVLLYPWLSALLPH